MAYDSVRAQLDKLLGPDRNGPLTAASKTPTDYRHPDICKHYLLNFCPNDLHIKHRSEPGSCRRQHSDRAKAAFEQDLASGDARFEKARWTVDLLAECRAIIADEDRKIRSHARRLKDTYNAQGDLSGLMIKSFETLKKLGMVSKNATVRIMSEIATDDLANVQDHHDAEQVAPPPPQNQDQPTDKKEVQKNQRDGYSSDSPERRKLSVSRKTQSDDDDDSDENGSEKPATTSIKKAGGGEEEEDDDDDDDDFGLIKVIPAQNISSEPVGGAEPDVEEKKPSNAKAEAESSSPKHEKSTGASATNTTEGSKSSPDGEKEQETKPIGQPKDGSKPGESTPAPEIRADSQAESKAIKGDHESQGKDEREGDSSLAGRDGGDSVMKDTENSKADRDQVIGQEKEDPLPSMEEFYERGEGPDGLLMLERKQSLRVCSCCGGFISLVDAESRLLSHYGGKTHHSLAQLRDKIPQLEVEVSAAPKNMAENTWGGPRRRTQERDARPPYRDNDRYGHRERFGRPPGRYSDKYGEMPAGRRDEGWRDRSRRDGYRGHGTSEWYRGATADSQDRELRRRGDERGHYNDRWSSRYSGSRKRHRSRSPHRDSHRSRRHY